ncbi:MAG: flagellar protein FlaG [Nitrospinaceae bacterium]|nr:flagellar protein FlaG [Nitrospinaceae bacterium]
MDTQAVNPTGNPTAPPPKTQSSSSSSKSKSVPTSEPKASGDSVDLSAQAKVLAEVSKGRSSSSDSEQRKFSVTDDNDVVLQVIDPKTQKVVKSVPTEEQMQLKNAVRDGISNITE